MLIHQFSHIFQKLFEQQALGKGPGEQGGHGHLQDFQAHRFFFKFEPEAALFGEGFLRRKTPQGKVKDPGGQLGQALQDAVNPAGELLVGVGQ